MGDEQPLGELEEQRLLRHLRRARRVRTGSCTDALETVERIAVDGLPLDPGDRLAHLLLEQREEELVLAVEVLVEAAQRLLRTVDDLLHGELGRALLADDLACRVQELLHARRPRARVRRGSSARSRDRARRRRSIPHHRVSGGRHRWPRADIRRD